MNIGATYPYSKEVLIGFYNRLRTDSYFNSVMAVIFVWGFLDTASTYIAIAAYGTVEYEWNPVTRELLHIDPFMLVVGKGAGVLAVGLLAVWGRDFIMSVPGWRGYFRLLVWSGVFVAVVNMYAAYTAFTGHDPVFTYFG